ncbi:MAG: hypothetical protein M3R24_36395 [Chloroflexota bacterium]|nr:hypothetical protein [Chloroflexota bacterium]
MAVELPPTPIPAGHTKRKPTPPRIGRRLRHAARTSYTSLGNVNPHLLIALALAFVYHGGLLLSGTFKRTYDAYVHIFFADHYVRAWFDHWDYRWYTGFPVTSYPPGSQQSIALLAPYIGLLNGFIVVQLFAVLMVTIGIYRFSKLWASEEAAGYAALLLVFGSNVAETVHVFGQLPTMFSLGFLLNALPYVRRWLDEGDWKMLISAWALNAATTAGHHVTTLFGAVFFVGPVIASAIVEKFREPLPDEPAQHPANVTRKNIRALMIRRLRRIIPVTMRAGIYGIGLIAALVLVVLPYWLWSRADPITQVPIPHASRDNFIVNYNAGIVFWLIPYGVTLVALPYAFYKGLTTRAWPMALSLALLVFLGTGGTTPFPKMLLGGAFDILTLDRFTFWATITVLPLLGEFVVSLRRGRVGQRLRQHFGEFGWRTVQIALIVAYLATSITVANFTQFRRFQPDPIDMGPIVNFLAKDEHFRWRYLTLGFGDQLAWLSAQTTATTVDGNYHSARRLPELTSTPVERLEGAKFRGMPGIGSLQQFLAVPDKYNLKYVFSNDQFYDPLLFFSGWHRVQRLENGIMVWERENVPPLPEVLPRREIPIYQRVMWGIVPMTALMLGFTTLSAGVWAPYMGRLARLLDLAALRRRLPGLPGKRVALRVWRSVNDRLRDWSRLPEDNDSAVIRGAAWRTWFRNIRRPLFVSLILAHPRYVALLLLGYLIGFGAGLSRLVLSSGPVAEVQAYYDDLDFRRFDGAYARLDPQSRPEYDQYLLQLSLSGGLVASYGKLDSVRAEIVESEPNRVVVRAETDYITALSEYPLIQEHVLVQRNDTWYLLPQQFDVKVPPQQFFRRGTVAWGSQGPRRQTTETTAFGDVLDRPELQILSAQLTQVDGRYNVVGELINTDVDPADVTVTAMLFDDQGNLLTSYNAQTVMMHKLFPKEGTPFRVDFEGVAGAAVSDTATAGEFEPGAYSPLNLSRRVASFQVYASAVVTGRDLERDVGIQNIQVALGADGRPRISGDLYNVGTMEAIIPHLLITLYDADGRVVWVDHAFIESAIRSQRGQPFDVPITPIASVQVDPAKGDLFDDAIQDDVNQLTELPDRIPLPSELGYASMRLSVHYFVGTQQ